LLSSRSLKMLALGLTVLVAGCDRQSDKAAQPQESQGPAAAPAQTGQVDRSHKGSELPDFLLKDPAGKELQLKSLKGQPLLINLWATWCAPCVAELPQLDALARRHAGKLKVLTVNQDNEKLDKVAPFLAERGGKALEPWLNPDNSLAFQFGADTFPVTILYDAEGREVWRIMGSHDWSDSAADGLVAEAR